MRFLAFLAVLLLAAPACAQTGAHSHSDVDARLDAIEQAIGINPPTVSNLTATCDEDMLCEGDIGAADDKGFSVTWQTGPVMGNADGSWSWQTADGDGPFVYTATGVVVDFHTVVPFTLEITVNDSTTPPPPPSGSPYDSLLSYLPNAGEWAGVPGTEIAPVLHPNDGSPLCLAIECNNSASVIRAWTSMAWDVAGGILSTAGAGGHADYGGNEQYNFDFSTLTWTRFNDPQPLTGPFLYDNDGDGTNDMCPSPASGPAATHHYDGIQHVPGTTMALLSGWVSYCANANLGDKPVWAWNMATGEVTPLPHLDGWGGGFTAYDPDNGHVLLFDRFRMVAIDPATWQVVRTSPFYASYGTTSGAFDAASRTIYFATSNGNLRSIHVPLTGAIGDAVVVDNSGGWGTSIAIGGGKVVSWNGANAIKTYDLTTGAVEDIVGGGAAVPTPGHPNGSWGRFGYIAEHDVFWAVADYDEPLWLFRLPGVTPPPQSGNFQERCSAPGVVLCDPLDVAGPYDGQGNVLTNTDGTEGLPNQTWYGYWRGIADDEPNFPAPQLDASLGSGGGSLHFQYPDGSTAAASGSFKTNISKDLLTQFGEGQSFFVQFRYRVSCDLLYLDCDPQSTTYKTERRTFQADGNNDGTPDGLGAFKIAIIGAGDTPANLVNDPVQSCTSLELVITEQSNTNALLGYNRCGVNRTWETQVGVGNYDIQHGGAYGCETAQSYQGPNCFYLESDEWLTIQLEVHIGTWQDSQTPPATSSVTIWAAREGQPQQIVNTRAIYIPTPDPEWGNYGAVWLLPFMTGKWAGETHPTAHIWYDELIVSTEFIADPS